MNSITELLNLEAPDIIISDICIQSTVKTLTLETGHHLIFALPMGSKCTPEV